MFDDQQSSNSSINLTQRLNIDFALQAAGLGVWEYNPASNQVLWDERCRALFGLAADNRMSYEQAFQHIHPDDIAQVDQAAQWVMNPQSDGVFDQTYRTIGVDDGRLRWVRFQGRVDFTPTGQVQRFAGVAQEVTQQVLTRQKADQTQHYMLSLFEQSPVGVALIDAHQLTFRMANSFYGQLVDRTPEQLIGKPLLEALPELTGQGFDELLRGVLASGVPYIANEVAVAIRRQQHLETIYVDLAYQPYYQDAVITGVFVVATDVTQQVLAHQLLAKSEARFRSLIEEAPIATCLFVGRELRIEVANQPMIQVWGKGPDVLGMTLADLLPELRGQHFLTTIDEVFTTGEPFSARAGRADLIIDDQLQTFYFDYDFKALRNAEGQVYAIMEMAVDVTPQVVARQKQAQSETSLRNAVELAQLGSFSVDVATGVITTSPRVADWFGFTGLSADAESFIGGLAESDRDGIRTSLANALRPDAPERYDVVHSVINAQTGRKTILHALGHVHLNASGQPVRLDGIAQDITSQRELQTVLEGQVQQRTEELAASNEELYSTNEELAASNEEYVAINEELEEANSLLVRSNENLQQFAYVASHDLQEPLRKIQQFGDILKNRLADSIASEELGYLERMQLAASRMSTLIKDLLSYSRIATQRNTNEAVSLQAVVDEVVEVLDWTISDARATVEVGELPTIPGDAVQLSQLFQNLLSNALKFARPGVSPLIHIRAQLVEARELPASVKPARRTARYYLIEVADNGIGFEEKYLDRIFQVFQRLHGKGQYAGTGVGLAICEKVVTNHGGAITASSQLDQGATFRIYLPA